MLRPRSAVDLHRINGGSRPGTFRRVHRDLGQEVSGDHSHVGVRVARVRAVPPVRPGNPPHRLLNQRDRIAQRPDPSRRPGERPFPERASRPQMCLPRYPSTRPDRERPGPMGHALETRPQRFQYRFRRKNQLMCTHTNQTAVTPLMGHSPLSCSRCFERLDLGEDWARWSRLTARYKTEKRVGGLTVLAIWQSLPATSLLVVSVDDPNERTRSVRGLT